MNDLQTRLDYGDAVAEWFLDLGDAHLDRGEFEETLKCDYIAASILSRQNRILFSNRIEAHLCFVAGRLAQADNLQASGPRIRGTKETCLHVVSEALPAGGLTAMTARWMKNDPERVHSLALLSQQVPVPERLLRAVKESGGSIWSADECDSFLRRAAWLRNLAGGASYVILHIDVCDVVCGAAFGVPGGPPVLMVNHAAHIFWNGVSFADRVLNCRGSALEGFWTANYRGVPEYATVPIPLPDPSATLESSAKTEAKKSLDLPEDAIVIITVGASFKYAPMEGIDFVEVCQSILRDLPDAFVLAVGFVGDDRWKHASAKAGGKLRTLGALTQAQLAGVHNAADVYIEGFPFGTTTALLESALKGIPVVLAPGECPPPYGTDGIAVDHKLQRPRTIEEYKNQVIRLSTNPLERAACGEALRDSIAEHHTGSGWRQHLEATIGTLPREHSVRSLSPAVRTPQTIHEHWSRFLPQWTSGYEASVEMAMRRALALGLKPRLTKSVRRACQSFRSIRVGRTIPLPVLVCFCDYLLPLLPVAWAGKVFRLVAFLCRGSLLPRVRTRLRRLVGITGRPLSPYEEYRRMRENPESSSKEHDGGVAFRSAESTKP